MDSTGARRGQKIGTIFLVLTIFVFPFCMVALGDTTLQLITLVVGITILVLILFVHHMGVEEDETRGICKGRNRVWVVRFAGGVLCLTAIGFTSVTWRGISAAEPFTWLRVLPVLFFVLWGVLCFAAASEYNRTIDRLEEYEAQMEKLGYKPDELGRLIPATDREDGEHDT